MKSEPQYGEGQLNMQPPCTYPSQSQLKLTFSFFPNAIHLDTRFISGSHILVMEPMIPQTIT